MLREMEARYGVPETAVAAAEFARREIDLMRYVARKNRAHDVTLLIRGEDGRFALIRKPSYPAEVFRPPSGGVESGESVEAGAAREAWEETGLEIRLRRYLLRVDAGFSCAGDRAPWTTHLFLADATGGELEPHDCREIAEARWATVAEIMERYRPALLAVGSAGTRYRLDLQDAGLRLLGLADPTDPPGGRLLRFTRDGR